MLMFMAGAGLAMSALGAIGGGQSAKANARAQIATTKGQIEVAKANQHAANAQAGLANFMTAFNNGRQLKQLGKALAAQQANAANAKDSFAGNRLESSIRNSEQLGAMAANMGASGSAGASFDAIESSARLRNARVKADEDAGLKQLNYNSAQERLGLLDNGLMGLDLTVNGGGVETSQAVPVGGGTNYASAIANSGIIDQIGTIAKSWGSSTPSGTANLTGGGLGLTTSGSYGLKMPSASTSFFSLGGGSPSYSIY